jgi:oligopeptide/dipeptide ABC transporter ATP-binding protein
MMPAPETETAEIPILSVSNLSKRYPVRKGFSSQMTTVLDDVSFTLAEGDSLGIVGESGSGKTTLAKLLAGHCLPSDGDIICRGRNLRELDRRQRCKERRSCQMIFQNHAQALNPRQTVRACLREALRCNSGANNAYTDVRELLAEVGLDPCLLDAYPAELSSGQRQRVTIARAIAVNPAVLIGDEPTANLDAGLRRQIIGLLVSLQKRFQLTLILISHDIRLISEAVCNVIVMYRGRVVESGRTGEIIETPAHPYTKMLLDAMYCWPDIADSRTGDGAQLQQTGGNTCVFSDRCRYAQQDCFLQRPQLHRLNQHQSVACLYPEGV